MLRVVEEQVDIYRLVYRGLHPSTIQPIMITVIPEPVALKAGAFYSLAHLFRNPESIDFVEMCLCNSPNSLLPTLLKLVEFDTELINAWPKQEAPNAP